MRYIRDSVDRIDTGIETRTVRVLRHVCLFFFFSSRRRHTRSDRDWSSDVCSSDLRGEVGGELARKDVVVLHRLDEAVASGGDAVLGAFELRLQLAEVGVALQLRIV